MFQLSNLNKIVTSPIMYENAAETGITTKISGKPVSGQDLITVEDLEPSKPETLDLKTPKKEIIKEDVKGNEENEEEIEENEEKIEIDELDELAKELEEPTEEQLELAPPTSRRAILKEFPELFKKFPSLEKSYYRDQKFTEHFATPAEAQEARESLQNYEKFETELMDGNLSSVLGKVRELDQNAFDKVIDNLLPTIQKIDRESYLHIIGNNVKEVIFHMYNQGKESEDKELQNAARTLNKFMFGNEKYVPPSRKAQTGGTENGKSAKELELERKEKEFNDRQFNGAKTDVMGKIDIRIKATISKHIDPKDSMPEYVKKNAIRDANELFESQLKNDKSFQTLLGRLWDYAKKNDYSSESVKKIQDAYISKANSLLDPIIKKTRKDALTGIGRKVRDEDPQDDSNEDEEKSPKRRVQPRPQNEGQDKGRVIPKGMTTSEWLNSELSGKR